METGTLEIRLTQRREEKRGGTIILLLEVLHICLLMIKKLYTYGHIHSYNTCFIYAATKHGRIQLKESHSKDQWGWIRPELSLQGRTIPTCSGATLSSPLRNNVALPVLKSCEFREASDPPHDDQRQFRSNTSSGLLEACLWPEESGWCFPSTLG